MTKILLSFLLAASIHAGVSKELVELAMDTVVILKYNGHTVCTGVYTTSGLVTAAHCIKPNADFVAVEFKGETYPFVVEKRDDTKDLALLKNEGNLVPFATVLPLAQTARIGEDIFLVGHPVGREYVFSYGVISALESAQDRSSQYFFHHYAAIRVSAITNYGASGGALVNMEGELVGIITQGLADGNGTIAVSHGEIDAFINGY